MSLEDLNKEIYKPDSEVENRHHEESKYDPLAEMKEDVKEFKEDESKKWEKEKRGLTPYQKKAIKIGAYVLGGILLILLIILAITKISQAAFNEKNVSISIEGENDVESAQPVKYKIIVKNNNWVSLKNAKISLNYSANFVPQGDNKLKIEDQADSYIDIGNIRFKSQAEYDINGAFFAPQGFLVYLNAALSYSPSTSSSFFQSKNQFGVNVEDSPLSIQIAAPQELSSGNQVVYIITYKNDGDKAFNDIQMKADYPDGFLFDSSDPQTAGADNNLWHIGAINPGQEGTITIKGSLQGEGGDFKILKVYLGLPGDSGEFVAYNQQDMTTKMAAPPLNIVQTVNSESNTINAGDVLMYKISYQNQSDVGFSNAIVTFGIEDNGSILDFSKLKMDKDGSFDASSKTITWRASDIPGLAAVAPGQGGEINITVPVLATIPVVNADQKDFKVVTLAKIDSPDLPILAGTAGDKVIGSNTLELKLNSKVELSASGFYNDDNIPNSGPVPPKVGQETSYTIHLKIVNVSNDIGQVTVSTSLPSGVVWKGKIYPDGENIVYNDRTNQIVWQAGDLKSGTGVITPAKEVAFQVSITPSPNQIERTVLLLNPSILTAKDLFTNSDVKAQTKEKTTQLMEDTQLGGKYAVTQ